MSWQPELINRILEGTSLSLSETETALTDIIQGSWAPEQVAAFLVALRGKGETIEEIAGAARVMRRFVEQVEGAEEALDIVGTGGDGAGTLNISTAAAFVAGGAGIKIAKHGNRSVSSRCGAADVLEALGGVVDLSAAQTGQVFADTGFCFMFAQRHHPSMRTVATVRTLLGIRTVFNLLGPLTNPASTRYQVVGVFARELVEPIAYVLKFLGLKRALVVHGSPGMDEVSVSGQTWAATLEKGEIEILSLQPADFGLDQTPHGNIVGGNAAENAASIRCILAGDNHPATNAVLANAAAGIRVAGGASTWEEACNKARAAVSGGQALRLLDTWVAATRAAAS